MASDILVTGAASGLGLAIAVVLAKRYPNSIIHALDRQPRPDNLQDTIQYHQFNITDEDEVARFGEGLDKRNAALGLVVHCAGIRGLVPTVPITCSEDVARAETLENMDAATMRLAFDVNVVGFLMLVKALMPSLMRAAINKEVEIRDQRTPNIGSDLRHAVKVVVLGSRMGSIAHNKTLGGAYAYRASKAALNAVLKSLSIDVPDVVWTIIHPGRVETGLVAVKEQGAMSVEESVNDVLTLIDRLGENDSGTFVDRFGATIAW